MERSEGIANLIGKNVLVFHLAPDGKNYRYEGILVDITNVVVIIIDKREGTIVLPLVNCKIKEAFDGS